MLRWLFAKELNSGGGARALFARAAESSQVMGSWRDSAGRQGGTKVEADGGCEGPGFAGLGR